MYRKEFPADHADVKTAAFTMWRNVPRAARRYIYRLVFFYIFGVLAIGVICPSDARHVQEGISCGPCGRQDGSVHDVVQDGNAGILDADQL
jgi:hypothetical protein